MRVYLVLDKWYDNCGKLLIGGYFLLSVAMSGFSLYKFVHHFVEYSQPTASDTHPLLAAMWMFLGILLARVGMFASSLALKSEWVSACEILVDLLMYVLCGDTSR